MRIKEAALNKISRITHYISRDARILNRKIPRAVLVGVLGVILMYVGVSGIISTTTPYWLGVGDSPRHIDYAWSVYNKNIPEFKDGLQYPVFNDLREGAYGTQPAAFHPPLFYALHAPIVGPLLESGSWEKAILVGRGLNILIGVFCIGALAWGGWIFGGSRKKIFAISVPAFGALTHHFTSLNLNYANDVLLILLSTASMIASYKLLQNGLTKKNVTIIALLSVFGMATKASFIIFLFTNLLSIIIAAIIHSEKKETIKNIIKSMLISGAIAVLVVISIGWFYYFWNYQESGRWFSSSSTGFVANRPNKTLTDVMTHPSLWGMLYNNFASLPIISTTISIAGYMGAIFYATKTRLKKVISNKPNAAIFLIMSMAVGGTFASQVFHAEGYGGFYFRYFLPVVLPIGIVFSYGLLQYKKTKSQLITLAAASMGLSTIYTSVRAGHLSHSLEGIYAVDGTLSKIYYASSEIGVPFWVASALIAFFVIGVFLVSIALYRLSSKVEEQPTKQKYV